VCRISSLRQPTVHNVRILTLHNHLRGCGGSTANGFSVRSPNRTSKRWNRWSRESGSDRLHPVLDELGLGPRGMRGAAREALLDKRSGELATIIEASAAAAIPPANRAARSSPRRSTTTIRNPRAGCDGTIVSVMRENASALRRRGNCVVSLTAGSVAGGIRRAGFWKSAEDLPVNTNWWDRNRSRPQMIGSLDTRPLSVSLSGGTSADRARLAVPGTRT
jgi:hypothetical protein